jgi:GrpB-like predicted nucleotidyltransferase (UPF0157 family)
MAKIEVVPYNPEWPHQFEKIKSRLEQALFDIPYQSIEHVGSTSVSDLWAKPIIDIDIVVSVPASASVISESSQKTAYESAVLPVVSQLVKHGYESRGWMGIPGRWTVRSPFAEPKQNTYVCVDGCVALRNHLGVRRVLRTNESLREEYSAVKRKLADKAGDDTEAYVEGKIPILQKILMLCSELTNEERQEIIGVNLSTSTIEARGSEVKS